MSMERHWNVKQNAFFHLYSGGVVCDCNKQRLHYISSSQADQSRTDETERWFSVKLSVSLTGSKKPKSLKQWRFVITALSSLFLVSCRGDLAVLWFENHRKWSNKETTKIKSPKAVVESLANETFLLGSDVRAVRKLVFAVVQIEIRSVGRQGLQGRVWKALDSKLQEILASAWIQGELGITVDIVILSEQLFRRWSRSLLKKRGRQFLSYLSFAKCTSLDNSLDTRKMKYIAFGIYLGNIIHINQCEVNTCFQGNLQHLEDMVFDVKLFRCNWVCVTVSLWMSGQFKKLASMFCHVQSSHASGRWCPGAWNFACKFSRLREQHTVRQRYTSWSHHRLWEVRHFLYFLVTVTFLVSSVENQHIF